MGDCHACLSGRLDDDAEEESVRVVRVTDGQLFEYPGPVYAKDLMYGFEGFAVFHYSTERQPLPPDAELKFSEIYYLRPWVCTVDENEKALDDGNPGFSRKIRGSRSLNGENSVLERNIVKGKTVRFLDDEPHSLQRDVSSAPVATSTSSAPDPNPGIELLSKHKSVVQVSPPVTEVRSEGHNGVLRVKLFIPKKKLCDLMSTAETADELVERIIVPLLSRKCVAGIQNVDSFTPAVPWTPSLEHIPEDA